MFGLEEKASEQEEWIPADQQGRRERMPLVRRSAWVSGGRAKGGLRQEQARVWGPGSQSRLEEAWATAQGQQGDS